MIKTLRITSIIAVILAVILILLPAAFGFRKDEDVEQLLSSAGAVEKFKNSELAGHVTFTKGERSKIATLASKIL